MGRPLKIAKAQAVVTITAVNGTTDVVTTNANFTNLGIIAGMPFIVATTTGGMTAGVTYWILQVLNSGNNSTFTVSETQLSANPTYTKMNLSAAGPVTVAASVGVVDAYFNNPNGGAGYPATNANTYSVVGGNTAIYGKQTLCNVAIGVAGTGTVFADTGSDMVTGLGTDFANVPSGTHMYALWGANVNNPHVLGTTNAAGSNVLVALANTNATGNIIGTSGNAQTLIEGGPVIFDVTAGGIVAGATYFVLNVANAAAFTITATPNGPEHALTTDASVSGNAGQEQIELTSNSANNATGVDGYGDPFAYATFENGYIVRQKGKQKYLVTGVTTGLTGACYTANVANTALLPNTMTITATYANASTVKVQSLSDHTAELFTATSGGPAYETDNINNSSPAFSTFNTAYAANTYGGQPYPIVTIGNA
jgi:hypothetical protein